MKSILVGIATALTMTVASMIAWMFIAGRELYRQFPQAEISFDLRAVLARPSILWLIGLLAFVAGFYWRFRRGSR